MHTKLLQEYCGQDKKLYKKQNKNLEIYIHKSIFLAHCYYKITLMF